MLEWIWRLAKGAIVVGLVIALVVYCGNHPDQSQHMAGQAGSQIKNTGGSAIGGIFAFFNGLMS